MNIEKLICVAKQKNNADDVIYGGYDFHFLFLGIFFLLIKS